MEFLEQLLKLTYKREIEIEKQIEKHGYSRNVWFWEDTKNTNVAIQIACLEQLDRLKRKHKYITGLH